MSAHAVLLFRRNYKGEDRKLFEAAFRVDAFRAAQSAFDLLPERNPTLRDHMQIVSGWEEKKEQPYMWMRIEVPTISEDELPKAFVRGPDGYVQPRYV